MKKIFLLAMVGILLAACSVPTVDTTKLSQGMQDPYLKVKKTGYVTIAALEAAIEATVKMTASDYSASPEAAALKGIEATSLSWLFMDPLAAPPMPQILESAPATAYVVIEYTKETTVEDKDDATRTYTYNEEVREEVEVALTVTETKKAVPLTAISEDGITETPVTGQEEAEYDITFTGLGLGYINPDPNGDSTNEITNITVTTTVPYSYYEYIENPEFPAMTDVDWDTTSHTFAGTIAENAQTHVFSSAMDYNSYLTFPLKADLTGSVVSIYIATKAADATSWSDPEELDFENFDETTIESTTATATMSEPDTFNADGTIATYKTLDPKFSLIGNDTDAGSVKYYMDRTDYTLRVQGLTADSKYGDTEFDNKEDAVGLEYKIWVIKQ